MSANYDRIKERYMKNYVTDAQLERYVHVGAITQEEADGLIAEKRGASAL